MAYDEQLASRLRRTLAAQEGLEERRMFGGLAFLLRGHMCCGIVGDTLMVRVGPERHGEALERPHARPMDFTGRPMRGMVFVAPAGVRNEAALRSWVDQALQFAATLPAKSPAKKPERAPKKR